MQYPHFLETLRQLGSNDRERAERLGITTRTLSNWRKNPLTARIEILVREPELIDAFAIDTRPQPADATT